MFTIITLLFGSSIFYGEVYGNCPDDITSHPFYRSVEVNAKTECPIALDCKGWYEAGATASGIYPVRPDTEGDPFQVYCDMDTDGGGWTVFMRRQDGSVDFTNRNWTEYESGFGNLDGEFWLGLSKMHRLTPNGQNTLRIDLGDFENNKAVAKYSEFEILDDIGEYAIVVKGYSGSAGDSLSSLNLMKFTTKDNDNDLRSSSNCATEYPGGGWWFKSCFYSRLTGTYFQKGIPDRTWGGVHWNSWKGRNYSLKYAEMKIRHA